MNLIHVKDICEIIAFFLRSEAKKSIKGKRVIVSCGAFRLRDLAESLDVDPLPEIIPPKGSKIVSAAKLCSILPANYEWTLPVPGVEPASRGLPTTGPLKYCTSGPAHDRQWELLKYNFRGKWQGTSMWYKKSDDGNNIMDHGAFIANLKSEELAPPSTSVPDTEYNIYFLDADTGIWHGKRLMFAPGGEKKLDLSRKTCNAVGNTFNFQGVGSQCSTDFNSSVFAAEMNFFYERSRSMIIVIYKPDLASGKFLLNSVCITPFRCGHGCAFPLKPPQSEVRRSVDTLLAGLSDRTCQMQWMSHARPLDETNGGEVQTMPTKSMLLFSDSSRLVQSFDDDLLCSIPSEVEADQGCELVFGCRHTDDHFKAVTLTYSPEGKLERFTFERWD